MKKYVSKYEFLTLSYFCPAGIDNGVILNINDICGLKASGSCDRPMSPAYIASKSALNALTESLRSELAQLESNIKVIVSFQLDLSLPPKIQSRVCIFEILLSTINAYNFFHPSPFLLAWWKPK